MGDYQPRTSKYRLPSAVYWRAVWIIRDYSRLVQITNPTATQTQECQTIEQAFLKIPEEYQDGVWENIVSRRRFPLNAHRTTYSRYKSKMIYEVAKGLNLIE